MSVEEVFAKGVGRPPSEDERARLYRPPDALGIRDNDAFWSIVMALEHDDAFFRRYPAELAEQVQRVLSEKVAETSVAIARQIAERPLGRHRITAVMTVVVAFGALCVSAGYSLATSDKPFWVTTDASQPASQRVLAGVLAVPAGSMIFALLVPAAGYGATVGWGMAGDAMGDRRDTAIGRSLGDGIENARAAFAVAAESETARVQGVLSEKVAETSVELARKLAERPTGMHRIGYGHGHGGDLWGAVRGRPGYSDATPERPFWVGEATNRLSISTVTAAS